MTWEIAAGLILAIACSCMAIGGMIARRSRTGSPWEREREALAEAQALANLGSWEWDLSQPRVRWSDELCRLFGQPLGFSPTYEEFLALVHPDDRSSMTDRIQETQLGEASQREYRIVRPDNEIRWVRTRRNARVDGDGARTHLFGTIQDITENRRVWDELETVNARLEAVLEHSPMAIYMRDNDERFVLANRSTAEILGHARDRLIGRGLHEVLPAKVADDVGRTDREVMASGESIQFEEMLPDRRAGRRARSYLSMKFPVKDRSGDTIGVGGISLDITDRAQVENALRAAEERLRATIDHAPIGVALVELREAGRGRLLSANDALCRMFGRPREELLQMSFPAIVHPDDASAVIGTLSELAADERARTEMEVRCLASDGQPIWSLLSGATVSEGPGGTLRYAVFHAMDIGERKHFEVQLQYLADHDPLTGLFNRRRFEEELERAVAHARRYERECAVLLIDLDGFKYVNDTLGHSFGDELVTRIASLLQGALRETDVVARLGGDEFAVILPQVDISQALHVSDKILAAVKNHAIVLGEDRHARVTASIGITTFESDSERTAEELVVEADIAMYEAKEDGKNRASVFVRGQDHRNGMLARQSWVERLKEAIADQRFELVAQPVMGICASEIERYELLLRLRGDDGDLIPPGSFLYIAERFDLIQQIDRWVFAQAAEMLSRCQESGQDISLSVNMSGKTLSDSRVLEDLRAILNEHAIDPSRLIVEVTETAAIVNIDKAREVARGLRELGCRFALDDFGAGFASFYYLKHLEFDYLKIDGEFIKGLNQSATDQLVVQSVVQIAHGLGARTVAEFVGDDEAVERLRELGVDYGQGYHLGRPAPIAELLPVLA